MSWLWIAMIGRPAGFRGTSTRVRTLAARIQAQAGVGLSSLIGPQRALFGPRGLDTENETQGSTIQWGRGGQCLATNLTGGEARRRASGKRSSTAGACPAAPPGVKASRSLALKGSVRSLPTAIFWCPRWSMARFSRQHHSLGLSAGVLITQISEWPLRRTRARS